MRWVSTPEWLAVAALALVALIVLTTPAPAPAQAPRSLIPHRQTTVFEGHGMRCIYVAKPGDGLKEAGGALACREWPSWQGQLRLVEVR